MSDFNPDSAVSSSAAAGEHRLLHHNRRHNGNPRKKRSRSTKLDGGGAVNKPRKPDPAAPKITRPCSECGKKFWSWKALFGHMRCHPERQWRGINPPPNHRRNLPPPPLSGEDRDGAASLLMLANGGGSHRCAIADTMDSDIDDHDLQRKVRIDGGDRGDTRWDEGEPSVNHAHGLGRYWALDLNFPLAHQHDTVSSCTAGLTLDLRLGL